MLSEFCTGFFVSVTEPAILPSGGVIGYVRLALVHLSPRIKNCGVGNSLAVQWVQLSTFTVEGLGSIPGQRTRIPQAAQGGQTRPLRLWSHEKILHTISFQRNTNQKHGRTPLHNYQDGWNWKTDSDKHRPGCGEGKTLCPAGKNGNQAADWKTGFLYDSAVLLLGVRSREMGMFIHTKPWTSMFTAWFTTAKRRKPPKCHLINKQADKQNWVPATHGSILQPRKGEALTLATTWTDPEDTMLSERSRHRGTHTVWFRWWETSRTGRSTDTESGFLVVRGWAWLLMGTGLLLRWWNILELVSGDSYTTLWLY